MSNLVRFPGKMKSKYVATTVNEAGPDSSMTDLARLHGYSSGSRSDLKIEPWMFGKGEIGYDVSQNLSVIGFDEDTLYFARVDSYFSEESYVIAFYVEKQFVLGEPWRYVIWIEYINHTDSEDNSSSILSRLTDVDHLKVSMSPTYGYDNFEMTVGDGVSIDLLRDEISSPIHFLASLFAAHAESLSGKRSH